MPKRATKALIWVSLDTSLQDRLGEIKKDMDISDLPTVCQDVSLWEDEQVCLVTANDPNFAFCVKHNMEYKIKRGYEIITPTPDYFLVYGNKRELENYNKNVN